MVRPIVDLHTHLEGSLPLSEALRIAATHPEHPWHDSTIEELEALEFGSFDRFLDAIRSMCSLLCSTDALAIAARELSLMFGRDGLSHAEVYVSPYIYERWGLDARDSMRAVELGFEEGQRNGGTRCMILLDSVRQWGVDAAARVLDSYEQHRWSRVVGFGLGGEESEPLRDFVATYERARKLGLRTVVHAGETGPASDVAIAVEELGVDRVAHGIRALDDPGVVRLLVESGTPLDLAITSNYATGVVRGVHPIRKLIDAGVNVTIGTDDPALFRTSPKRELERAIADGELSEDEVSKIARDSIRFGFFNPE